MNSLEIFSYSSMKYCLAPGSRVVSSMILWAKFGSPALVKPGLNNPIDSGSVYPGGRRFGRVDVEVTSISGATLSTALSTDVDSGICPSSGRGIGVTSTLSGTRTGAASRGRVDGIAAAFDCSINRSSSACASASSRAAAAASSFAFLDLIASSNFCCTLPCLARDLFLRSSHMLAYCVFALAVSAASRTRLFAASI